MRKNTIFFLLPAALVLCMLAGCTGNKTAGGIPKNAVGISASGDASGTDRLVDDTQFLIRAYLEKNFFFQAEDGIRDLIVTEVQTCALPISSPTHPVLLTA